jgi:hypothetical protein
MKMTFVCKSFHRLNRNTLKGFADITAAELQLTINVALHQKGGSRWVALPSKPMLKGDTVIKDETGKIKYIPVLQFASREVGDAFSAAAIRAVLEHDAEVVS